MSAKMGNFSKSLSHMETPLKVVRCSQSLCGVPYFRSPTGDVVVVVVDVAPIWMLTPHNVLVASLVCPSRSEVFFLFTVPPDV